MSPKKKSRRKLTKSRAATAKKKTSSKAKRNKSNPKAQSQRKSTAKKASRKTAAPKRQVRSKTAFRNDEAEIKRDVRRSRRIAAEADLETGDLQGISRAEQADSESVEELVEEGNLFEAGAVAGVEQADNADEREVRTHELPEDDVPEEYWDKE